MSSGQKRKIFNTRERVISGDQNDLQNYIAKAAAQTLRRRTQRIGGTYHPDEVVGVSSDLSGTLTQTWGTVHDVIHGLMVRPDNANYLLVDPGSLAFYAPGYSGLTADDSPYIVVDDPGVQSTTVLTFTANGSGSPRIDIIECRPVETTLSTQSRDIYNTTTGQFTAASVPKVASAVLEYRIRLGTANAGFPTLDAGWCPLAYCVVQSGATGFAQADFYDVRPLVTERDHRTAPWVSTDGSQAVFQPCVIDDRSVVSTNGTEIYSGWVRGSFQGYRFGGLVERNTASSLADFGLTTAGGGSYGAFDYRNNENHVTSGSHAVSTTNGASNCLVAVFPNGLGRCVRYSQTSSPTIRGGTVTSPQLASTGRLPRGFNGILCVARPANVGPMRGCMVNQLPASFGTAIATANYIGAVVTWLAGNGTNLDPYDANGRTITRMRPGAWAGKALTNTTLPSTTATSSVVCGPSNGNIDWVTNPHQYPNSATKVRYVLTMGTGYSAAPTFAYHQHVTMEPGNSVGSSVVVGPREQSIMTGTVSANNGMVLDIPVPGKDWSQVGGGPGFTLSVLSVSSGSNIVSIGAFVDLAGWDEY